jgi:hypothetical protein
MLCINRGQAILNEIHSTRAIRKVTSCELLTKQTMRTKFIIYKNTYILKLLLNVVTAGIEVLVSGNKICMPVSREVYCL